MHSRFWLLSDSPRDRHSLFASVPDRSSGESTTNAPHRTSHGGWQPARTQSGHRVLLSGWIDNDAAILVASGASPDPDAFRDPARLYALALDLWGDDADRHIVGHYAAASWDPERGRLRLVRSPWNGPPIHYFRNEAGFGASSLIRTLHACGLSYELNPRKFADNLFFNLTEDEGWFADGYEVKPGTIVTIDDAGIARRRYHDPLAPREPIRLTRPGDYVEAVDALLEEATRSTLRGVARPAMQLSGGLDSSNVAARVLRALPQGERLHSFTFGPHRDWGGSTADRFFADEREAVEAFAAMYPQVSPHFTDNRDDDFDSGMAAMFDAIGIAPISMLNPGPLHGVYAMAQQQDCDLMISAAMGNCTFSPMGDWGAVEYLQRLRLIQLYRLLRDSRGRHCSIPRFFLSASIKPLLPDPVLNGWRHLRGQVSTETATTMVPLRQEAIERFDLVERARAAGILSDGRTHRSRRENLINVFARGDMNAGDYEVGFQQIYGMPTRDIAGYAPLAEFCVACPTDVFVRDGQERWLARELGKGMIPESIRTERRAGRPSSDWHFRLSRRLPALREELVEASHDPFLSGILDFEEILARIDRFPETPQFTQFETLAFQMGLPRAIMAARYVRHVKAAANR